jgi:hypothetical protein
MKFISAGGFRTIIFRTLNVFTVKSWKGSSCKIHADAITAKIGKDRWTATRFDDLRVETTHQKASSYSTVFCSLSSKLAHRNARSKSLAQGCSLAGIEGSNPAWSMYVWRLWLLCVGACRGCCDGPITRPGESHRAWMCYCVTICSNSRIKLQWLDRKRFD